MDMQTFKLEELNPASYNPRKNLKPGDKEYEKIKNSIEAFGFVEPLIVNIRDGANRIVGGHQRYKVLKELGVKDTKCVVVDYDDITEKACNVALNKVGGAFDQHSLSSLLEELNASAFDVSLTGFDPEEISKNIENCKIENIEDLLSGFTESEITEPLCWVVATGTSDAIENIISKIKDVPGCRIEKS